MQDIRDYIKERQDAAKTGDIDPCAVETESDFTIVRVLNGRSLSPDDYWEYHEI